MDRDTWLRYFEASPSVVQHYLLNPASGENEDAAQEKLAYDNDAWERVEDVAWEAIFNKLSYQDFRERLSKLAGDRKAEDVERAVLFHVVLPLADLVTWDVEGRLQELKVPLAEIQSVQRVTLRPVSYGAAVRRMAAQAGLSLLGEEMVRRARELLVSYIKGVRTVEQVQEMLDRNQAEGGLGFSKDQAAKYVETMKQFLSSTQVMSEQEYAEWLSSSRQATSPGSETTSLPAYQPTSLSDDAEIAAHAASTPQAAAHLAPALEQAIDQAMTTMALPNLDEYLTKRLRNIISTRLRDVRSSIQTKAMLERDQHVGGLGLKAEEAQRVADLIEKGYQEHRIGISDEEKKRIEFTLSEQKEKIEQRKTRESEEHAKWFQEKVQSGKKDDVAREQMIEAMKRMQSGVGADGVRPGPSEGAYHAPLPSNPRPAVDSVIPPPSRLTGLAEELSGMGISDFRRLAKMPDEAAQKVKQKLETLRQESYEKWEEGIEAWRKSPIQQAYLKLVAESFAAGRPVAQVAEERRKADPNALSAEEIGAIIRLNGQIHF